MILPEADFEICFNQTGMYFNSETVDLDKDSLVCPIFHDGGTGTIEFHRKHVVIHPANSDSKTLATEEFVKLMGTIEDCSIIDE